MESGTLAAWIGGVGLPLLLVVGGIVWYLLRSQIDDAKTDATKAQEEVVKVKDDLQAYKLQVAEKYVSTDHLKEVETRIVNAVEKMERAFTQFVREYHDNRASR